MTQQATHVTTPGVSEVQVPVLCQDTPDVALLEAVTEACGRVPASGALSKVASPANRDKLGRVSVALAPVDGTDVATSIRLCEQLVLAGVPVVVMTSDPAQVAIPALRAGVSDVIGATPGVDELRAAIARAEADRLPAAGSSEDEVAVQIAESERKVVAVVSPKGGVGRTMVATNLALGLAKIAPDHTVLVDLDVMFGNVTTALNMDPQLTLPDMVPAIESGDQIALKSVLARHPDGLYVVGSSDSVTASGSVDPAATRRLVQMLAESFRFVVIDTAPGWSDHTMASLDVCNELVLVSGMDVMSVRDLEKLIRTLAELNLLPGRRHLVVNECESNLGLTVADIEANLNQKVDVQIGHSKKVPLSMNAGVPMLADPGKDPAVRSLQALVARVSGVTTDAAGSGSKSFLNKLRKS